MFVNELEKEWKKVKEENGVAKVLDEKVKPLLMTAAKEGKSSVSFSTSRLIALARQDVDEIERWVQKEGLQLYVGNVATEIYGWDKKYTPKYRSTEHLLLDFFSALI